MNFLAENILQVCLNLVSNQIIKLTNCYGVMVQKGVVNSIASIRLKENISASVSQRQTVWSFKMIQY
jgi:hypothetical protein